MQEKPKYIKDAIMWNGYDGVWVRTSGLNYIQEGDYYTPVIHSRGTYIIREAYPYQEWMEEYIGTNRNLLEDERFRNTGICNATDEAPPGFYNRYDSEELYDRW